MFELLKEYFRIWFVGVVNCFLWRISQQKGKICRNYYIKNKNSKNCKFQQKIPSSSKQTLYKLIKQMVSLLPSSQGETQLFPNQSVPRLCDIHENQQYTLLCTDPSRTDCAFKCDYCVVDQALQGKYLIPISQIQNSNSKTVFWHWPLPEDSELIRKIRALSARPKTDVKYKDLIDKYFKELRIEILAKIDSVQEQMRKQSEQLWDFDNRIIEQYNVFCAKETLKKIVFDS